MGESPDERVPLATLAYENERDNWTAPMMWGYIAIKLLGVYLFLNIFSMVSAIAREIHYQSRFVIGPAHVVSAVAEPILNTAAGIVLFISAKRLAQRWFSVGPAATFNADTISLLHVGTCLIGLYLISVGINDLAGAFVGYLVGMYSRQSGFGGDAEITRGLLYVALGMLLFFRPTWVGVVWTRYSK